MWKDYGNKCYFIDERAEIANCKNKTKVPASFDVNVSELQSTIGVLEAENKLLKESSSNKQKLLEVVLEHNSVLIKEKSKHFVNPIDKQMSLNKRTCDSQNHMGFDKANEKMLKHAKTINNARNNGEKPQADRTKNGAKANKDSVIIVGDWMIKHVNGRDVSRSHTVKVRPNPEASTRDLMNYVKPAIRKKPKDLVIQTGTNGIQ